MRPHAAAVRSCLLAAAWALPGVATIALAQAPPAALLACRSERDDGLRLKCYDREADRVRDTAASTPVASSPVAPAPRPAAAAPPAPAPATTAAERPKLIDHVMVSAVEFRDDKTFLIQLDNGQTWEQTRGEKRVPIAVGEEVSIRRMPLGSYLLSGPHSRWSTQVRRKEHPETGPN